MKSPAEDEVPPTWAERPLDWLGASGGREVLLASLARARARRQRRRLAGLGAAVAIAGLFAFGWHGRFGAADASAPAVAAADSAGKRAPVVVAPERRTLADGSVVELRGDGEVAVAFAAGDAERRVALLRGQAHFAVAPDAARPFVVVSDAIRFRAVGTAFAVERLPDGVELFVTEGRVAIESATGTGPLALVAAGERARLDAAGRMQHAVAAFGAAEVEASLGWRTPRIEFDEVPLGEAVRVLARHGGRRIELADPSLARLEITGALRAGNLDSLLAMLRATYGLHAEPQADGALLLRRAPADGR
jgi:transmembrane sensor